MNTFTVEEIMEKLHKEVKKNPKNPDVKKIIEATMGFRKNTQECQHYADLLWEKYKISVAKYKID